MKQKSKFPFLKRFYDWYLVQLVYFFSWQFRWLTIWISWPILWSRKDFLWNEASFCIQCKRFHDWYFPVLPSTSRRPRFTLLSTRCWRRARITQSCSTHGDVAPGPSHNPNRMNSPIGSKFTKRLSKFWRLKSTNFSIWCISKWVFYE